MQKETDRVAVIVIHGIGEQSPMGTMSDLCKSIIAYEESKNWMDRGQNYFSAPDDSLNSFELNKWIVKESTDKKRSITDFYEYYWAHYMDNNSWRHITGWLLKHVLKKHPPRIIGILIWAALVLTIIASLSYLVFSLLEFFKCTGDLKIPLGGSILGLLLFVFGYLSKPVINYLADAVRYFDPKPYNIAKREKIRRQGVELLESLSKSDKYDRIVVVGHSLGSVVGYDILRLFWSKHSDYYKLKDSDLEEYHKIYNEFEEYSKKLRKAISKSKEYLSIVEQLEGLVESYQAQQFKLFKQLNKKSRPQKEGSNYLPWKVSDFITLGSPLSQSKFFLANNRDKTYWEKTEERTIVCNPPIRDLESKGVTFNYPPGSDPRFHHGSIFAMTRWTNIYHLGDYIGGPIDKIVGLGTKNICVKSKSFFNNIYLLMHTSYWATKIKRTFKNNPEKDWNEYMVADLQDKAFVERKEYDTIHHLYEAMHIRRED